MSGPTEKSKLQNEGSDSAMIGGSRIIPATGSFTSGSGNPVRLTYDTLTTKSAAEDAALLRLIAKKKQEALRTIYSKYSTRVHSLALRILKDEAEAEELVQEVFLHVWHKASLFDPDRGSFESWLVTLAHHRAIDVLRTRRYRQSASETKLDPVDLAEIRNESTVSEHSGLSDAIELDERRKVYEAFAEIAPEQKQVLELAYYEGYSQSEIAEKLDLPLGTVKTRMRQGMLRLSKHLKDLRYRAGGNGK